MNDVQLYSQLLGISKPWVVSRVELNSDNKEVLVYVETSQRGLSFPCPECHDLCPVHDFSAERRWRHLDSCGFSTFLVARVPRVNCGDHGVKTVAVPWSAPHSRFTLAFETFVIAVLKSTMVQSKAAALLGVTEAQIHGLMHRAVQRGLERRRVQESEQSLEHLSLDEKSFQKGHRYITVLGDSQRCRVLDVVEGRTASATIDLLEQSLTESQRKTVHSVTMDMWSAFMSATDKVLPEAVLVHDRFHVVKHLNQAVDQTRRMEQGILGSADGVKSLLKRTRYIWLSNAENLSPDKRDLLNKLRDKDFLTANVWAFKEAFREFYNAANESEARIFFQNWMQFAQELGCRHLTKVALMLEDHLQGLLNYHAYQTTNATAEGLNSQIQRLKTNARGFRRFENFRVAILFFFGRLDLRPQSFS